MSASYVQNGILKQIHANAHHHTLTMVINVLPVHVFNLVTEQYLVQIHVVASQTQLGTHNHINASVMLHIQKITGHVRKTKNLAVDLQSSKMD